MQKLNNIEMTNITGGGIGWILTGIGAGIIFIIGVISGYVNPNKCKG